MSEQPMGRGDIPFRSFGLAISLAVWCLLSFASTASAQGIPTVTAVTPNIGPAAGGNTVVVTGTGFVNVTNISVIGLAPPAYTVDSSTQITLSVPPGFPTTGDIRITTTAGGPSGTGDGSRYTYRPVPAVTFLTPNVGFTGGGVTIDLFGITLTGATAVSFGAIPATFTVLNDTRIRATAPAGALGTVNVTVVTPDGTTVATTANEFEYTGTLGTGHRQAHGLRLKLTLGF